MMGKQIGSYEILDAIGEGGMATVYRAYQAKVDRHVAMKVIRQHIARDERTIQRFQREARLVARLEHPHILPVYDFDGTHDPPYIVMRLMESGTLRDVLRHGFLPTDEIIQVMRQLASALDYAHQQGVVHRDIKPSNIMLDREGNAFITDLGIARIAKGYEGLKDAQITESGSIVGTPDYMAPEQIMDPDLADPRTDVYALGVVAYQMLCGQLPFDGASPMLIMLGHLREMVPPVTSINTNLPPKMDAVIERALAKDASERYQTGTALVDAIAKVLSGVITASSTSLRAVVQAQYDTEVPAETRTITEISLEQQRTVTSVYVDMTDTSEGLRIAAGPDDATARLENLLTRLAEAVYAQGGQVMTQPGYALIGLWGADKVHEDDAERAVRAALTMQAIASDLSTAPDQDIPLLNIGVNTGTIMLLVGSSGSREITAEGVALSLAKRISAQAFGTVLIGEDTYRQVRGIFDVERETSIRVRPPGTDKRDQRIRLYLVTGVKDRAFSLRVRGVEGVETALIGRRAEMEVLQKAYYDAVEDHETRAVTLVSEAGLGKSRLLRAFLDWIELRPERVRLFRGRATPAMAARPYALLRDLFSFRFEILDSDEPETVRTKLEHGVHTLTGLNSSETAHLIGYLCGFDIPDSPHIPAADAETVAVTERAVQAVRRFIVLTCRNQPVYVELDDMHHADDASLDILADLLGQRRDLPLLVAIAARPDLYDRRPNWGSGHAFHTHFEIRPLDRRDSRDLAAEILQKVDDLPRALRDLLVERAEGNPYYMEELVKMLIEDRVVTKGKDAWTVEESRIPHLAVPPTLIGLLQARIDTLLYPERVVLQRASVLGRVFHDQAIHDLRDADNIAVPDMQKTLDALVERGFIYRRERSAFAGTNEYVFAQTMIRDRIYDSLPDEQIRAYSLHAAEWLINRTDERVEEYTSLIADLYERAGENAQAIRALLDAADQAEDRGAYTHARRLYGRALDLLPEGDERRGRLLVNMGDADRQVGDLDSAEQTIAQALIIGQQHDDKTVVADAHRRLGLLAQDRGDLDRSRTELETALALARDLDDNDDERLILTLNGLGITLWQLGEFDAAITYITEMSERATARDATSHMANAANLLGIIRLTQERYDEAAEHFTRMLRISKDAGNVKHEVIASVNLGEIERLGGRYETARNRFFEGLIISEENAFTQQSLVCLMNLGDVNVWLGDYDDARDYLRRALHETERMGATGLTLYVLALYARLYARTEQPNDALDLLGGVLAHPAADEETRGEAERVRDDLGEAGISAEAIATGLARGSGLDLSDLVAGLLRG